MQDNYDKQRTYARWKSRYKLAMKSGFYVEALVIDATLIEDRLRSFLYYIGVFNTRDSYKADNKRTKAELYKILAYCGAKQKLYVSDMKGKIALAESVMRWSSETEDIEGRYQRVLKAQCEAMDIRECLDVLEEADKWRLYRNEIMHALMNKNLDDLDRNIEQKAEEGMQLASRLDNQIKILKKGNRIRRALNLQA